MSPEIGKKEYVPPVGPGSKSVGVDSRRTHEGSGPNSGADAKKPYVPPVGPGSNSVPPTGDYRDLPPGMIPRRNDV